MADQDENTTETDAVVIKEGAGDPVVVEGTVDDPPTTEQPAVDSPAGDAPSTTPPPTPSPPPSLGGGSSGTSPAAADRQAAEGADGNDPFAEKPELFVAGAFLGGIVLAKLIGALFGPDDD